MTTSSYIAALPAHNTYDLRRGDRRVPHCQVITPIAGRSEGLVLCCCVARLRSVRACVRMLRTYSQAHGAEEGLRKAVVRALREFCRRGQDTRLKCGRSIFESCFAEVAHAQFISSCYKEIIVIERTFAARSLGLYCFPGPSCTSTLHRACAHMIVK